MVGARLGPHCQCVVGQRLQGRLGQTNQRRSEGGDARASPNRWRWRWRRKGVTVNTISHAGIHRDENGDGDSEGGARFQNPAADTIGRLGKPEEIAGLIIYLCSDEAAFVTGANIAINGGSTCNETARAPPFVRVAPCVGKNVASTDRSACFMAYAQRL